MTLGNTALSKVRALLLETLPSFPTLQLEQTFILSFMLAAHQQSSRVC